MLKPQIKKKTSAVSGKSPVSMRLVIICYNQLLGEAVEKCVSREKNINLLGVFGGGMDFKEISRLHPDVMIMDLDIYQALPDNFAASRKPKIFLIGSRWLNSAPPEWFDDFISRGGVGVLPPAADSRTLKKALKAVSRGEFWMERKSLSETLSRQAEGMKESSRLSETEKEVAALICLGCRNKEVAQKLNVSENTVKSHCNRIYKKLEVSDRLQLAVKLGRDQHLGEYLNRFRPSNNGLSKANSEG